MMRAFNFWEQQRASQKQTTIYLSIYCILLAVGGAAFETIFRFGLALEHKATELRLFLPGLFFATACLLVGLYYYYYYTSKNFQKIAHSTFEALPLPADLELPKQQMLFHIVEEMAIASRLPIPQIFLIPVSEINSLTLGAGQNNYAILITEGALESLSRDELQAMIAYEMSHVKENNLKLNMRLSAMLMSFYFMMNLSARLLSNYRGFTRSSKNKNDKGNPMVIIAVAFLGSGTFLYVFGAILQRVIAHQRVYLADASAVQFTRNSQALYTLLSKIKMQDKSELPRTAEGLAHFYFSSNSATHPNIDARLVRLDCPDILAKCPHIDL